MKISEIISDQAANALLAKVGMTIGDWHDINIIHGERTSLPVVSFKAPKHASELFCFAQHIAGWIPKGDWKILVTDCSNSLSRDESLLVSQGAVGHDLGGAFNRFFRFGLDEDQSFEIDVMIANIIFLFLLFEGHAYLTSSSSKMFQILGIQDGYAYLYAKDLQLSRAEELLKNFEYNPRSVPKWVSDRL